MGCVPSRSSVWVAVALTGALLLGATADLPARARSLDSIQRLGSGSGLRWPIQVQTTSDGSLIFVLNEDQGPWGDVFNNALASYRAQGDGAPELADLLRANTGELLDLQDAVGLAVSPDDRHLYVAGMTRHPESGSLIPDIPVIAVLAIQPDGALEYRSLVDLDAAGTLGASGRKPSILLPSPDGRRLYVVATGNSFRPTLLDAFDREPISGALRLRQELSVFDELGFGNNTEIEDLAIAPDGDHLYLRVNPAGGQGLSDFVVTLDLSPATGRITGHHGLPEPSAVPAVRSIRHLFTTDDPTLVFASMDPEELPDGGMRNRLLLFTRDFPSGDLLAPQELAAPRQIPVPDPFSGIRRGMVVAPDALYAYQCLAKYTLQVYRIDIAFNQLDPVQTLDLPPVAGSGPRCDNLRLAPDGRSLFLSDSVPYKGNASLTRLRRDPASGQVTVAGVAVDEGTDHLTAVAIAPDGGQVYAIRTRGDVLVYRRDTGRSGRLEPLPEQTLSLSITANPSEVALVVSPDGRHLYVGFPNGLVTLARDPANGALRLVQLSAVMGSSLVVSADGQFAYAKSSPRRSPRTGAIRRAAP